jgi:hypothetical protein
MILPKATPYGPLSLIRHAFGSPGLKLNCMTSLWRWRQAVRRRQSTTSVLVLFDLYHLAGQGVDFDRLHPIARQ